MLRTRNTGSLRALDIGQVTTLTGWVGRRRDYEGVAFIDLRDASGIAQVVIHEEIAYNLHVEYVLTITEEMSARSEGNANPNLSTGEIEVVVPSVETLGTSAPLSFQVSGHAEDAEQVGEGARLRCCYLGLRRSTMWHVIRLRAKVSQAIHRVSDSRDFVEIETPILTRFTPESIRDFLAPARLAPGSWYVLPWNPQLLEQLLMVAGMECYHQITHYYRDEDFHADRQPEFIQFGMEMSFVEQGGVIAVAEDMLCEVWALTNYELPTPTARMTYHGTVERYGSSELDLRFDYELVDLADYFKDTTFRVSQSPYVGTVVMPGGASQSRRTSDVWQGWAKQRGAKDLAYVTVAEDGALDGPVIKDTTDAEHEGLTQAAGVMPGDCIFFVTGPVDSSHALLGATRLEVGRRCGLIDDNEWSFVWIVGAPLFKPSVEVKADGDVALDKSARTTVHRAFTSPKPEYLETFDTDPGGAPAHTYNIVYDDNEVGGGSIRAYRNDVQERVFSVMGIGEQEAQEKFGFLLNVFKFGAPPHGGIAFGWDRIVSLLTRANSIRNIIAFPKSSGGFDPLTGAPAPITPE